MSAPNEILIDVRTPAEFATGALSNDLYKAVNIEYQLIDQLPQVYAALGVDVNEADNITLYCRSGRRSNIALQELKQLGYQNVRDIGGFEEARATLKREEVSRQLEKQGVGEVGTPNIQDDGAKKEARNKSFGALLSGLKDLE
ncbi:hypothetical protein BS50DRAFT_637250 [Corynespora cassiicola Philippines]|uniref:Rhodanese domain-containing protein n=1 Tax=Corynespora cassiicola Philippines TaxID=1448308 RepID=A0A2T2NEP9_CORCC|nr:hypothetical protein BS50DRAFT_637250 [Corynespora cassiicola Philippines]